MAKIVYGVTTDSIREAKSELDEVVREYASRVIAGVGLLDEKLQPGWHKKIDLPELDLSNTLNCVLGQLAAKSALRSAGYSFDAYELPDDVNPNYEHAVEVLEIEGDEYGFNTNNDLNNDVDWTDTEAFGLLQHLWTDALRLRKKDQPITVSGLMAGVQIY